MSAPAKQYPVFPIGTPGVPWGQRERDAWRSLQKKQRDYVNVVVNPLRELVSEGHALHGHAEVVLYGEVDYRHYGFNEYHLIAVRSVPWNADASTVVVTGGVHGYETSGVLGAVRFAAEHLHDVVVKHHVNVLVLPCIVPWAFETVNRWNPDAIDPNRCFNPESPGCYEAALAMSFIAAQVPPRTESSRDARGGVLVHFDLHETTDSDNAEFVPARFARDGVVPDPWSEIPDGFFVYGDTERDNAEFLLHIIREVRQVTHIAKPDENGQICGEPVHAEGVVICADRPLRLCALHTTAPFAVTTEVYPDSAKTTPEECIAAQVRAVTSGVDFAVSHRSAPCA